MRSRFVGLRWSVGIAVASLAIFALVLAAGAGEARAWTFWGDGCNTCHGAYVSPAPYTSPKGGTWTGSLHTVHTDTFNGMGAACDLCHVNTTYLPTYLGWSNGSSAGDGFGCAGCHARLYAGVDWPRDVGLVAIHVANTAETCIGTDCHQHENHPTAHGENVLPVYYGLPDSKLISTCRGEDFSGDGLGLDNDGDGLRDWEDPDCPPLVCGDSTREATEVCDGADLGGVTCLDQGFVGGTLACLADCTGFDTTGCESGDTCGNGVLDPGETCDPQINCPVDCPVIYGCIPRSLHGSAATCDAECVDGAATTACVSGDGCCPAGCGPGADSDCSAPPTEDDGGCGCATGRTRLPLIALLLLIALVLGGRGLRRKRSR